MRDSQLLKGFITDLQTYPDHKLREIPSDGGWSLGQMYQHLIEVSLEYLENAEACSKAAADPDLEKSEGGKALFERGGFPPIKIKLPDLPGNTPSNNRSKQELLQGFLEVEKRMERQEKKASKTNPACKQRHGGFGWLNAAEWYVLVDMHLRHHLRQKKEIEQKIGL
ncbi:DinB family protein [Metabacillus sp. JX24]|uniref:DinB family protein n=1 Tax=Metabacillus sp. JX24 TaxID=3240759 RepID=UPI00350F9E10